MGDERRRHPRVSVRHPARAGAEASDVAPVRIENLSRGGALLISDRSLGAPGDHTAVEVDLPGQPVMLRGRIVRTVEKAGEHEVALHLSILSATDRRNLGRVVQYLFDGSFVPVRSTERVPCRLLVQCGTPPPASGTLEEISLRGLTLFLSAAYPVGEAIQVQVIVEQATEALGEVWLSGVVMNVVEGKDPPGFRTGVRIHQEDYAKLESLYKAHVTASI